MSAYIVTHINVHDPEAYQEFVVVAQALFAKSNGELLVQSPRCIALEGESPSRVIIQRFPDAASAQAFYDSAEYQDALRVARASATRQSVLVPGA